MQFDQILKKTFKESKYVVKVQSFQIHVLFFPSCSHPKQCPNLDPNKTISIQGHVTLALLTKPCNQTNSANSRPLLAETSPLYLTPIDLSTGPMAASDTSALAPKYYASELHGGYRLAKTRPFQKPIDLTRNSGSDFTSFKTPKDSSRDDEKDGNSMKHDSGGKLSGTIKYFPGFIGIY